MLPRSVFFHIPKTGGVWVRKVIAEAGIPTTEAGKNSKQVANMHNRPALVGTLGKFSFAFVRHPLSWYRSFWSYRMLNGWRSNDRLDPCLSTDFGQFIRNVLRRDPGHLSDRYNRYVGPAPGKLDFVGRTENLVEDLVQALRHAGETFDEEVIRKFPRQNVSSIQPVYPEGLSQAVLDSEQEALVRFGYV